MRKFPLILILLLGALALGGLSVSAQEDAAAGEKKSPAKELSGKLKASINALKGEIIDAHLDFGERYLKQELYADARRHLFRVLLHDPHNPKAHKLLGHKLVEGKWNTEKEIPRDNPRDRENEVSSPASIDKGVQTFAEEIAIDAERVAKQLEKEKHHVKALEIWKIVLTYSGSNAAAAKARGWTNFEDKWMTKQAAKVAKASRAMLKEGLIGVRDRKVTQVEKDLKITFEKRKSAYFVVRTTGDSKEAKRVMKILNGTAAFVRSVLSLKKGAPTSYSPYHMVLVTKRKQFSDLFLDYHEPTATNRAYAKEARGVFTKKPRGYLNLGDEFGPTVEDSVANSSSLSILNTYRSSNSGGWIITGFPYYITANLLGTSITRRYTLKKDARTRVFSKKIKNTQREYTLTPAEFRQLAREFVEIGDDLPLLELAKKSINQINEFDAAKSFAIFEYCFHVYPEKTKAWLKLRAKKGADELNNLEKAFGMSTEEFEAGWRKWVLKNY